MTSSTSNTRRLTGPLFVTGESLNLFMNCKPCGAPLISLRSRLLGICPVCLREAGAEVGSILIVPPPALTVRWN